MGNEPRFCAESGCVRRLYKGNESGFCARHRMQRMQRDPERRAALAERMRALHRDPDFARARDARISALHNDPDFAARRDANFRRLNADPEFRARVIDGVKRAQSDPKVAAARDARVSRLGRDPSARLKMRLTYAEKRIGRDMLLLSLAERGFGLTRIARQSGLSLPVCVRHLRRLGYWARGDDLIRSDILASRGVGHGD